MTTATVATEDEELRRLIEFASEVYGLASERRDLDLGALVSDLHADLLLLELLKEDET